MILFSFEVPLKYLEEFNPFQDYIFSLSFLYSEKVYKDYILRCKDKQRWIFLDNSYNELKEATSVEELKSLYLEILPDEVMCPDNDTWDVDKYLEVFTDMKEIIPYFRLSIVARNLVHYNIFRKNGIRNISIPYEFRPEYTMPNKPEGFLPKEAYALANNHFLGLNTSKEPFTWKAKSVDTSMPIKIAMEGLTLTQWEELGCPHIDSTPDFFHREMSKAEIALAKSNITELKQLNRR